MLYLPEGGNLSLPRLFFRNRPLREYEVVHRIWLVETLSSAIAVVVVLML